MIAERLRTSGAGSASVLLTVGLVTLVGLGVLSSVSWPVAIAAALLVALVGMTIYEPVAVPVLAMPAFVVVERVGGGGADLSLSDFALFGAFWFALLLGGRPYSRPLRTLLWLSAFYQVTTLFTVIVNPFMANTVEWFHAWLSVAGALIVGWAVGRAGRARLGLTLLLAPCLLIAALTVLTGLFQLAAGDTGPVYLQFPYPMHKNFIGTLLSVAALVAYARPWWVGWPPWFSHLAFWLCSAGVLASQARQALVGIAVGVMVLTLRAEPGRRRSRWIWFMAVPAIVFVWQAVAEQFAEDNEHNSANQRLSWYADSIEVWSMNPLFGMGLRWWTSGRTPYVFQPPNAEIEMLSSAGVVGLIGFLALFVGGLIPLWRMNPRFGNLAMTLLLARFVQGQFDLFWVAVQVSLPFVVIGVCLGAEEFARVRRISEGLPPVPEVERSRDRRVAVP